MIVYKFVSDCVDMINTSSADIFDQVTDNPGTSVQPSWLAENPPPTAPPQTCNRLLDALDVVA